MSMLTLAAGLAAAALAFGTLALAPAAQAAEPLEWVAMGDSYMAGSGTLPLDPSASVQCSRSLSDYSHVAAARIGAHLTDVACGGAKTKDFTEPQFPDVPPQLDALDAGTDLVTLGIGGNDSDVFGNAMQGCAKLGLSTLGQGSPCKDEYGTSFADTVDDTTYPAIKAVLQDVMAKAPHARVAVLSYLWILPPASDVTCFLKMPIAGGDVPYLRDLQAHLTDAARRAAAETGAEFVDFSGPSDRHNACAPILTRWVEPLFFGTDFVPVHPNIRGERAMAGLTLTALGLD